MLFRRRDGAIKELAVKVIHGMVLPCLNDAATSYEDDILHGSLLEGLSRLQGDFNSTCMFYI